MKIGKLRRLYSLGGTVELLEYIDQNPGCTKRDLKACASQPIVSLRLAAFREYGLIEEEELKLTALGKKYLSTIREIEAMETEAMENVT